MIKVTHYQNDYFDHLVALHESQDSDFAQMLEPSMLPDIGYVAYEGSIVVAMGFLRIVEGGYGQIDTLVTNGDLSPTLRHNGVSEVVNYLIAKARIMKLKGLICLTNDEGILSRANSLGFHNTNQTAIALSFQ